MWTKYFTFVKLLRGRVVVPIHGEIDFSRDDIPVETCTQLYEAGFPYLEITEEGKKKIYGVDPVTEPEEPATTYIDLSEKVETEVSPPNRKKH